MPYKLKAKKNENQRLRYALNPIPQQEANKKSYRKHRKERLATHKARYEGKREKRIARSLEWIEKHKEMRRIAVHKCRKKYASLGLCYYCGGRRAPGRGHKLCVSCRIVQRTGSAAEKRRIKEETFSAYGGKCACCGESNFGFLTIDHPQNDGAKHRREAKCKTGISFCRWLRRRGFPKKFQLLCWNCNCGKNGNGGICPHIGAK